MNIQYIAQLFYPDRILDIGANIGQFHLMCKNTFPDSFIFSIEASPECQPYLDKITENYYIGLLAKNTEEYSFFSRKNDPTCTGNSIYRELTPFYSDENLEQHSMHGVMLDDLFEDDSVFDLIKIDTQGSELDIISGGKNLCKKAKGILLEVSLEPYNDGAPLKDEVDSFMKNFGFEPKMIIGESHHPIHGHVIQHDILYTPL